MAENPFLNIRQKVGDTDRSIQWYQNQIRTLANLRPNNLMSNTPLLTGKILPGNMYMFFYDAKYKDILPYFDAFPLVLPFRITPTGFYGVNLHYLPYGLRFKVLGALSDFTTNKKLDETTKIRLSWNLLKSLSVLAPLKACTKQYLFTQLESRFLKISYPDWITASLLPVEQFKGAEKTTVWKDTRKKY